MKITYRENKKNDCVYVYLDDKKVGKIFKEFGMFYYQPNGSKSKSDGYETLNECKKSLE